MAQSSTASATSETSINNLSAYIASPEGGNGRNLVALGVFHALEQAAREQGRSAGVFRPIACKDSRLTQSLLEAMGIALPADAVRGVCPQRVQRDPEGARGDVVARFHEAQNTQNATDMLAIGSDATRIFNPNMFTMNVQLAADLQLPVFLAVCTRHRSADELAQTVHACMSAVTKTGNTIAGIFVTGANEEQARAAQEVLHNSDTPIWTLPPVTLPTQSDETQATGNAEATKDSEAAQITTPQEALRIFAQHAAAENIIAALNAAAKRPKPLTPYAFQYSLLGKAKAHKQTIVLPEGEEARILQAADYLLARDIVNLIIVGERDAILQHAAELKLTHLENAQFQSMHDEAMLSPMIDKLCQLRAKKGMTPEQARQQLADPSYFGTMLVVLGHADGLVSGAVNSTANTVRPALQVIKTKPQASLVSGAFLMCFDTHVAVFADCAINLNPSAQQLAEIAMQSAQTAQAFGIEPRVGMLSYSTLGSGKGPDVELVEEATRLVQERMPELPVVGPIQFDAAWSPSVAATKAKGNAVAGHVNVFVFPDLSAGNIGYKAVQRSSGALAIGPVLQGLNKPVNDLSRGALVQDIVNTIALTAIEAQD